MPLREFDDGVEVRVEASGEAQLGALAVGDLDVQVRHVDGHGEAARPLDSGDPVAVARREQRDEGAEAVRDRARAGDRVDAADGEVVVDEVVVEGGLVLVGHVVAAFLKVRLTRWPGPRT